MKKIAITGGLASGKSTVCHLLGKLLKAYTVDADEIVHQLLSLDSKTGQQVVALLGKEIINKGSIDRKKIAEKVFSDLEKLACLEKLLHPIVIKEIERQYNQAEVLSHSQFFIAEIPLLYEIEAEDLFDYVIAVIADAKTCQERYIQMTGASKEQHEKRQDRQWPQEKKATSADYTIVNNGNKQELEASINKLSSILLSMDKE